MKFLKNYSYDLVKLCINQIGITIFSLVIYSAIGFIENDATSSQIRIWVSLFCTIFYMSLIYCACWDYGARDRIRVDGGKIEHKAGKGFLIAFLANIPNFLVALVAVIFMIVHIRSANVEAGSVFFLLNLIIRFTNAMFLGLLQGIFSFAAEETNSYYLWQMIGYLIAPIFTCIAAHIGYTLGFKEFRILSLLGVNPKVNKE